MMAVRCEMAPPLAVLGALALSSAPSLLQNDATELSNLVRSGGLSAADLMAQTLDRIEAVNPKVNAMVSLRNRQELLKEAIEKDKIPVASRDGLWLHGIPFAVKDNANVAGIRTTEGGSPLAMNTIPSQSDLYVQRIQEAGAIMIGKTNCPESCLGSHTVNNLFGVTRNPNNLDKSAGGSSGGAAVAVATGMLAVADGSDMMGSLRNPAGWNGMLYSHRPTAGWLEHDLTHCPLRFPISTPGPIGRSVRDVSKLLETMVGDSNVFCAASSSEEHVEQKEFRIGWLGAFGCSVEDGILECCREALQCLELKGACTVVDILDEPFPSSQLWSSWIDIRSYVIAHTEIGRHGEDALIGKDAEVKPELQWEVRRGLELSSNRVAAAVHAAQDWQCCLDNQLWSDYDAIAMPSAQVWPFDVEWDYPKKINSVTMDTYHRWMQLMIPSSLAGLPTTTIPAGRGGPSMLPMGIQIAGPRGSDANLLKLASNFEAMSSNF